MPTQETGQGLVGMLAAADEHDLAGRYGQAAHTLDGLIEASRAAGGASTLLLAALTRRAALFRYAGHLEAASDLLSEAMQIVAADPSVDTVHACELHIELGGVSLETSGPDAADAHLDRAVELARSSEDAHVRAGALVPALTALAASRRLRGDYASAELLLREALDEAELAHERDPADRRAASGLVHVLDELGVLFKFSGEFQASEAMYRRAEGLLVEIGGPDHPDMATIQHNLGGLAHARGDGAAAASFARRAVDLHERSLGPDHLATVLDRSALAAVLDQSGASIEAEAMLRDCAERLERTLGPHHRELAVVVNNLAAIAQRAGRLDAARDLYERAVAIKERALGPGSPSVAITLNNLATVQRRQARFDDAAVNYARALDIVLAAAGADHPHVDLIRRNMARLEADRGDQVSGA